MAIEFELTFRGKEADENLLDFYDAAQAMSGFQRSLALTTHFVLNNEIITQAPSLKGAQILARPPREGSWEIVALIVGGVWAAGTASKDTPLGHVISSVYDYVVSQTLGVHVDYSESLGQTLERYRSAAGQEAPRESQVDSLIEKCEVPIKDMHRPIVYSETASSASIYHQYDGLYEDIGPDLDEGTWEYVATNTQSDQPSIFAGWASSYNINTFKGRVYLPDFGRPIPFTMAEEIRNARKAALITTSLNENAKDRLNQEGRRHFEAFVNRSSTGRVKSIHIVNITVRHPREL